MTKHKFKVGDKVRGRGGGCVIIYTIIYCATANDTTRSPMYLLEAENKTHVYAYERELELANMIYKYKVGDILIGVSMYNGYGPLKVVYQGKMSAIPVAVPGYLVEKRDGCHTFVTEDNLKLVGT